MTRLTLLVATATVVVASSCGDSGSTTTNPTPPPTTSIPAPTSSTLNVASGENGQPVQGAAVTAGGSTQTTGADGRVVTSSALARGQLIDIVAEGFFDRNTLYRADRRFTLWPLTTDSGLEPDITQRLVYTGRSEVSVPGELPMARPSTEQPIVIWIEPSVPNDPRVDRVVGDAVAAMEQALQGRLTIEVTRTEPSSGTVWHVRIDPDATSTSEFAANTSFRFTGEEISRVFLSYRTLSFLVDDGRLITKMMGSAFGMLGSPSPNDRMSDEGWWMRGPNDFSPRERLVMRLMLQRPAGNRWPDNDRSLGPNAAATRATTIRHRKAPGF